MGKIVRIVLTCIALAVLTCIALVGGLWGYSYLITDLGRLTNFTSLEGSSTTSVPDSNYALVMTRDKFYVQHIALLNKTSNEQVEILIGLAEQAYLTFNYQNRKYIMVRSYGGGTDDRFDYVVLDISSTLPRQIGDEHVCSNPKLNNDSLEFYNFSSSCDFFPFGGTITTEVMKLS